MRRRELSDSFEHRNYGDEGETTRTTATYDDDRGGIICVNSNSDNIKFCIDRDRTNTKYTSSYTEKLLGA